MKLKPIAEQVVVLFGASSGIGRAAALKFADRGAKLVLVSRDDTALLELVGEVTRRGGQAIALAADTADPVAVQGVAERAVARFGRLDTWVHLAAVSIYAPFQ